MVLTGEEKTEFLDRVRGLLDMDVITKEVRDAIYKTLIVACVHELRDGKDGADKL